VRDLVIRQATVDDLEAIDAIYNDYVLRSTCTYQTEPDTPAGRQAWFDRHGQEHPIVVAEAAGEIVGWGSLSVFRPRAAYRHTVEDSVYVREDVLRQGIGSRLLAHLIAQARALGHHTIIAAIDSEQTASIAFHANHGFVEAGRLEQVGFKFGRWLGLCYMQLMLE
jgi:L-amino acid N-acyltransferase